MCEGSPTRAACCSHRSPSRSAPTRRCARWHVHVCRVTTVDHCECCGRRLARGRRRDLSALRTLAPATLLVLVLLLVLAVASRSCSSCCANHRQLLHLRDAKWSPAARRLGYRCSRAFARTRLTASSSSARPPRPPTRPRLPDAGPAHMLAHCPASAPRARTSRRACLASTDAPRRDAQNLPRRISPRDGSREHEPRTCAIAQRFLRVPHRSTYAYACTRTRPRSRRPDDSPEEQERRRARRHAARPVTGGRAAVTEAGRPVAARPRKSKVVPMAASGRGYVLGASGEITCRRALRQAVRPTTGGRIWRWRGGRPILAGRPRPIFCAVHACMNAHAEAEAADGRSAGDASPEGRRR